MGKSPYGSGKLYGIQIDNVTQAAFDSLKPPAGSSSSTGGGTVTSVALVVPTAELSVAGSPVTGSGTFTVTKTMQLANTVWAGPASGSSATSGFRTLVIADMPSGFGTGTVTSVGLSLPTEFVVAGSPVTSSGSFAVTKSMQLANTVWAGPTSGSSATSSFRTMVIADLPDSGVTAGTYTNMTATVNAKGQVTSASSGSSASTVIPSRFEARLSLTSGAPVTITDVTAAGTIYLTPYKGCHLSLYTSSVWTDYTAANQSASLGATVIRGVTYDVFAYDSGGGTVAMELVAWKKTTATNSPTGPGFNKVINVPDTSGLTVDQLISLNDGVRFEIEKISVIVANTSVTVIELTGNLTTPDLYGFPTRVTALAYQDDILVKSGASDKRYVGTLTGQLDSNGVAIDTYKHRMLWNYYNRIERPMKYYIPTNSWSYTLLAWRQCNADTANQIMFTVGVAEDGIEANGLLICANNTAGTGMSSALGHNVTGTTSSLISRAYSAANNAIVSLETSLKITPIIGFQFVALLESSTAAGSTTQYGDNNVDYFQSGVTGSMLG